MSELYQCKILVVEDEHALRGMICDILSAAGFCAVYPAENCAAARRTARQILPDAVLLDVMLPDGDGFSLMPALRDGRDIPVLFLSARDADADRLHGLGLGADDYIVKPFLPQELVLRLTAVLRRAYGIRQSETPPVLRLGGTTVIWGSGTVRREDGSHASLTAKEYALLRKLADNRGNIVTIDALCRAAWDEENFGYENTLMVHIRRLRSKIEQEPSRPCWLVTVRGLGYKLAREAEE